MEEIDEFLGDNLENNDQRQRELADNVELMHIDSPRNDINQQEHDNQAQRRDVPNEDSPRMEPDDLNNRRIPGFLQANRHQNDRMINNRIIIADRNLEEMQVHHPADGNNQQHDPPNNEHAAAQRNQPQMPPIIPGNRIQQPLIPGFAAGNNQRQNASGNERALQKSIKLMKGQRRQPQIQRNHQAQYPDNNNEPGDFNVMQNEQGNNLRMQQPFIPGFQSSVGARHDDGHVMRENRNPRRHPYNRPSDAEIRRRNADNLATLLCGLAKRIGHVPPRHYDDNDENDSIF